MAFDGALETELEMGVETLQSAVTPFLGEPVVSATERKLESAAILPATKDTTSAQITEVDHTRINLPTKRLAVPIEPRSRLIPLQTWEGYVEAVDEPNKLIRVRLCDLEKTGTSDEEIAEISFDEIYQDDLELVRPGAVFRWIIGYREQPFGRRERVSSFVFRRLPSWTESDLESAQKKCEELARAIRWK